jgi:hypothetical protein
MRVVGKNCESLSWVNEIKMKACSLLERKKKLKTTFVALVKITNRIEFYAGGCKGF